jgi:hypothetical protein
MPWEETQTHIQNGLRSPSEFQENTLKTIELNQKDGIQAIVGKPKDKPTFEIQSYLFSKDKGWTVQKAQAWTSKLDAPANEHLTAVLPFTIAEKIVDKPLRIQGLALTVGMSRNFNIYTPQELEAFQGKLLQAPVYLEHVTAQDAIGKVTKAEWDGQNLQYEAEIYDDETADKIRKGLIRHVSVGADYQTIDLINGKIPHGLYNAEMSLVAVPGIPDANIQILERLQEQTEPTVNGEYTLGFYQDPADFLPEHLTTVWLDKENGVLAVMGKLKAEPQSQRTVAIYFSSQKQWNQNRIQTWLAAHTAYIIPTGNTPTQPEEPPVIESLIHKTTEPSIPISHAIRMIQEALPSNLIQRSWTLGPQRMCQELNKVLYRLKSMEENQNQSHKLTASN